MPHGHDLLPLIRGEVGKVRDYACLGMDLAEFAIRTHLWHLILPIEIDPEEPRSAELYRKPEDRWDQNNVIEQHVEVAEHLELALAAIRRKTTQRGKRRASPAARRRPLRLVLIRSARGIRPVPSPAAMAILPCARAVTGVPPPPQHLQLWQQEPPPFWQPPQSEPWPILPVMNPDLQEAGLLRCFGRGLTDRCELLEGWRERRRARSRRRASTLPFFQSWIQTFKKQGFLAGLADRTRCAFD